MIIVNTQIRRLEEEISDLKSAAVTRESDLENSLARLRSVEDQYATLQSEHAKTRNELEILQREYDLLKSTNINQESELERLRNKIQQYEVTIKEQKNVLDHLKAERERLQNIYRDKVKQLDHLTQLVQSFDVKMNKMRQNLRDTSDKLIAAETERNTLRSEVTKLQQELQFGKDQMVRRTDEYQSSLEDLANAHRAAEDGRLNALQELESRRYELADLKVK
uniref:BMA-LFI-1 n=1 Tax=Brugia malayi TaxID=6279 RepID=A0A0J9YD75_BRUMA|nr:BMA-LFI-1 [Brugia malayi]